MSVAIRIYPSTGNYGLKLLDPDEILIVGNRIMRNAVVVKMPTTVKRLFLVLAARQGHIVSRAELVDLLWGDDEDGGPEFTDNLINQAVVGLRDAGAALGFRLDTVWGRGLCLIPIAHPKEIEHAA